MSKNNSLQYIQPQVRVNYLQIALIIFVTLGFMLYVFYAFAGGAIRFSIITQNQMICKQLSQQTVIVDNAGKITALENENMIHPAMEDYEKKYGFSGTKADGEITILFHANSLRVKSGTLHIDGQDIEFTIEKKKSK